MGSNPSSARSLLTHPPPFLGKMGSGSFLLTEMIEGRLVHMLFHAHVNESTAVETYCSHFTWLPDVPMTMKLHIPSAESPRVTHEPSPGFA